MRSVNLSVCHSACGGISHCSVTLSVYHQWWASVKLKDDVCREGIIVLAVSEPLRRYRIRIGFVI
jgi:hypothetical protein